MGQRAQTQDAARVLQAARAVVTTGYQGREALVDTYPRCNHCGKRVGEYFGLPWSLRCANCRQQAKSG